MGAEQSSKNKPPAALAEEDIKRLLESQRKIYEEKCKKLMKQVSELETASTPQTVNPPQTSNPPQTANPPQTSYPPENGNTFQNVKIQQSANPPPPTNLPQTMYPQLQQHFNQPNANVQQNPLLQPVYSQPTSFPQQGYPQQQHFNFQQNPNIPQFAQAPHAFSQQAGPQPGFPQPTAFPQQPFFPNQQPHVAQQPLYPQQLSPAPPQPAIPPRPSQLVIPQPAQRPPPQPAANTCSAALAKPNLTRPLPAIPTAPPAPRERSQSRPRINSNAENELDCATCGSPLGVGIFRCNRGHNSCVDCKTSNKRCKICFQAILNVRNYDLELKAVKRKVACPNKEGGCNSFVKISEMENHTTTCPYQPQKCPLSVFGNCNWTGQLNKISSHFKSLHPSQRETNVDTELQLQNVCKNSRQLVLVVLGVYNFVLHVKVSEADRNIYMTVQLIGTKKSAEKWIYEIHVYNKNEANRKYTFTDTCHSSSGSVEKIFKQRHCAVLPFAYATTFVYKDVLTYKVYMKKIEDPNEKPKRVRKRNNN